MPLELSSPAFGHNEQIPVRFTADGEEISPPLSWTELPEGTRSLALVCEDPDAPDPANPKRTFTHWVVFNIPPDVLELDTGAADRLPKGAVHGLNDRNDTGWAGPKPPIGEHRYFFKLYALDTELDLHQPTRDRLMRAMQGHALAKAELIGRYRRVTAEV